MIIKQKKQISKLELVWYAIESNFASQVRVLRIMDILQVKFMTLYEQRIGSAIQRRPDK